MQKLTKESITNLSSDIRLALEQVELIYGVKINLGTISYTSKNASVKLSINTVSEDGTPQTKEAQNFDFFKGRHGLSNVNVGDTINIKGTNWILAGWNTRARKMPIKLSHPDKTQTAKISVEYLKSIVK